MQIKMASQSDKGGDYYGNKSTKSYKMFSPFARDIMEEYFSVNGYPSMGERIRLGEIIDDDQHRIRNWFKMKRRNHIKRKQDIPRGDASELLTKFENENEYRQKLKQIFTICPTKINSNLQPGNNSAHTSEQSCYNTTNIKTNQQLCNNSAHINQQPCYNSTIINTNQQPCLNSAPTIQEPCYNTTDIYTYQQICHSSAEIKTNQHTLQSTTNFTVYQQPRHNSINITIDQQPRHNSSSLTIDQQPRHNFANLTIDQQRSHNSTNLPINQQPRHNSVNLNIDRQPHHNSTHVCNSVPPLHQSTDNLQDNPADVGTKSASNSPFVMHTNNSSTRYIESDIPCNTQLWRPCSEICGPVTSVSGSSSSAFNPYAPIFTQTSNEKSVLRIRNPFEDNPTPTKKSAKRMKTCHVSLIPDFAMEISENFNFLCDFDMRSDETGF